MKELLIEQLESIVNDMGEDKYRTYNQIVGALKLAVRLGIIEDGNEAIDLSDEYYSKIYK